MALYSQVNTTDTIGGQAIMVLVPSVDSDVPYNASNPTRVVLYAHGSGEDEGGLLDDSLKAGVVTGLLTAGYILAGSNERGNNWGTQTAVDDLVALEKYVRDNYNVEGVAIWSQSMGGLSGLLCLAQGKFPVVGWLGTYPVCNLANLYSLGTYTSDINTAHSITGSGSGTYANRTRGLDPALLMGFSWRHVPMRFYASTGDTVVPKANNTDVLAALVAGCARETAVVACSGNHGDTSHFDATDYLAFFERCFDTPVATRRPTSTQTITLRLTSDGSAALPSLTGLRWAWWDQATPDLKEWPTDQGTAESTDGSGDISITIHTSLTTGQTGWLEVTESDGDAAQSPPPRMFSGPVEIV